MLEWESLLEEMLVCYAETVAGRGYLSWPVQGNAVGQGGSGCTDNEYSVRIVRNMQQERERSFAAEVV